MTDYPRFLPVEPEPCDRGYHGAPLVNIVFRLVDSWQSGGSTLRRSISNDLAQALPILPNFRAFSP
jgi:hypothetical protein